MRLTHERGELIIELLDLPEGSPTEVGPVPVPEVVRRYHPAVASLRSDRGRIEVTAPSMSRASRLLHALAIAAENRGYKVDTPREGGIGWVPAAIERADRQTLRHYQWSKTDSGLPSEVFQRNFWFCMIEEPVGIKYRHDIGIDRILWECDYPHVDTPWPHSQKAVDEVMGDVPADEVKAICHENAERLFRWEMAPLPADNVLV